MNTDLFDYHLPEELIAQRPSDRRGMSQMVVLNCADGQCELRTFPDITDYIEPGDALIFNDTKVMKARMYGRKNGTPEGARFEILLLAPYPAGELIPGSRFQAMLKPGKRAVPGTRVALLNRAGEFSGATDFFTVAERLDDGTFVVDFPHCEIEAMEERCGHIPLPPYIKRNDEEADFERYQTIFAKIPGAVAAPTAGLHFTEDVLNQLKAKGVATGNVTLHVGMGTFQPVSVSDVTKHKMHRERFVLSAATADLINATHRAGKRVIAVGTTTVRTLESCANANGSVTAQSGSTDIFLYPPYKMRCVDALLTNFHLPKSTLIMLVACMADREKILNAYQFAIDHKLHFFSYGDCMFLK